MDEIIIQLTLSVKGSSSEFISSLLDKRVIMEKYGYRALKKEGTIDNSVPYYIFSAGHDVGNDCIIKINGIDYSSHSRGLNIVVYDKTVNAVIYTGIYDIYSGEC